MSTEIDRIEATLLAREKEAYARVRREHGEICAREYGRYFTPEERADMWVMCLIYGLKSTFMTDLENPAEYDKEKVANEFSAMILYLQKSFTYRTNS